MAWRGLLQYQTTRLLEDLGGLEQHVLGDGGPERLRGLEVYDEL